MECVIRTKNDNKLIGRSEMHAEFVYSGSTPSNDVVRKELARALKIDEALIVVKHIYSKFGKQKAEVVAFVYPDKKALEQFEVIKKKPKKAAAEAPQEKKAAK